MVTDIQKSYMVMLNGLGWTHKEIANEVGLSRTTVGKYLNQFEDESMQADDWRVYYAGLVFSGLSELLVEQMFA